MMDTIDIKFRDLCDEIDYWKEQANYWESESKKNQKKLSKEINNSINNSKKMIETMFDAVLDPKSIINKGNATLNKSLKG